MARVKRGLMRHKRHKKIIAKASGYFGRKKNVFSRAHEQVMKSGQYAFRDRRRRKRDFRRLWIARISGACASNDIRYSHLIHGMGLAGIEINRKVLSEMAIQDPAAFSAVAAKAKAARG
jgi:large subunit ribosomal protein L20